MAASSLEGEVPGIREIREFGSKIAEIRESARFLALEVRSRMEFVGLGTCGVPARVSSRELDVVAMAMAASRIASNFGSLRYHCWSKFDFLGAVLTVLLLAIQ